MKFLKVAFDEPAEGRPLATLRSMYVTDFNNDVGRIAPSRHNTSSPDMVFGAFSSGKALPPVPAGKQGK